MLFPDICAKSGKWFHRRGELFRRPAGTKHWREKSNNFNGTIRENEKRDEVRERRRSSNGRAKRSHALVPGARIGCLHSPSGDQMPSQPAGSTAVTSSSSKFLIIVC
jgi:hypothetical protein